MRCRSCSSRRTSRGGDRACEGIKTTHPSVDGLSRKGTQSYGPFLLCVLRRLCAFARTSSSIRPPSRTQDLQKAMWHRQLTPPTHAWQNGPHGGRISPPQFATGLLWVSLAFGPEVDGTRNYETAEGSGY